MNLYESSRELLIEQRNANILREAFLYDVQRLEEARGYTNNLLTEGVIHEDISDEHLLDEGIFDTLKNLGRNIGNIDLGKAASAAVGKVKGEYNKAKAQGVDQEIARLQARLAVLQAQKGGAAPAPAASAPAAAAPAGKPAAAPRGTAAGAKRGAAVGAAAGGAGKTKATVAGTAGTRTATASAGAAKGAKVGAAAGGAAKAAVQADADLLIAKMKKDDPKGLEQVIAAAKDPKKLQSIIASPEAKKAQAKVANAIATDPEAAKKPGLFAKIGTWAKKNPVKAGVGIAALGALAAAATLGTGGMGPILAAGLVKAGLGAKIGAAVGAAKSGYQSYKAGNKVGQIAKDALKGGLKGGVIGGATGLATGMLGGALGQATAGLGATDAVAPAADDFGGEGDGESTGDVNTNPATSPDMSDDEIEQDQPAPRAEPPAYRAPTAVGGARYDELIKKGYAPEDLTTNKAGYTSPVAGAEPTQPSTYVKPKYSKFAGR